MRHRTGRSRRRRVGHASIARVLLVGIAVPLLIMGVRATALAQNVSSQPTNLSISSPLPSQLAAGVPVQQSVTATGQGIFGCYRWSARSLPTGLRLAKTVTCVPSGRTSSTLGNAIVGTPATKGPSFVTTVTVTVRAIGLSKKTPTTPRDAGSGQATVIVLPPAWDASGSPLLYQGTSLNAVSCAVGPTCWVAGISTNPLPAGTTAPAVGDIGEAPAVQGSGSPSHPALIQPGTFVAALVGIKPLRMQVVRVAIPVTVNAMACPTVENCVLVGSAPLRPQGSIPAVLYMTNSGAVWHVATMPSTAQGSFSGVDCPSTVYCLAVGSLTSGSGFADRIALAGAKPQLGPLSEMGRSLSSISCANATSCVAVGVASSVMATKGEIQSGTDALIEATSDGGGQWRVDQVVARNGFSGKDRAYEQPWIPTVDGPLMFGGLTGVGCAPGGTTNSCDVTWPFWPADASTSDGTHWYPNVVSVGVVGAPGASLSCPAAGRCFSVTTKQFLANNGAVETATQILETIPASPGWEWGIAGMGPDSAYSPSLTSISCPTISTCVAVGFWYPVVLGSSGAHLVFPLVMAPQLAMHPYFKPHPPVWAQIFSWQTLGLVLGAVSLVTGIGGLTDIVEFAVATENVSTYVLDLYAYVKLPYNFIVDGAGVGAVDVLSFLSGVASTGIGAALTSVHDPIGWIAIGLGLIGLSSWAAGLSSLVGSGADPTGGTPAQ